MSTSPIPSAIGPVVAAENITQLDRLKLIILGEPGCGKSWLACTGRKPILVYDFDDRKESIAGKPGVFIKTVIDRNTDTPTGWSQFENDIAVFEYEKQKGNLQIKTIVVDSITFALKAAQNQLMKDNPGLSRSLKIGSQTYKITQGWDAVNGQQKMFEGALNRLYELGVDVICCAHIRREKDPSSTEKNPIFTDKYTIEPQNLKMLLPGFNERWLMTNEFNNFRVKVKPALDFNAVTALKLNNDFYDNPSIIELLGEHQENMRKVTAQKTL